MAWISGGNPFLECIDEVPKASQCLSFVEYQIK